MNRARDQFFASTGFPLEWNCGICRRNTLNLLEHGFQSRTVPDELLKSLRTAIRVNGSRSSKSSHRDLLTHPDATAGSIFKSRSNTLEQGFVIERFRQKL